MIPAAIMKAIAINHDEELLKALRIPELVTTPWAFSTSSTGASPTRTITINPTKVVPAIGRGLVIHPTIVATKMANVCHAWTDSPAGTQNKGIKYKITPITTGAIKPL